MNSFIPHCFASLLFLCFSSPVLTSLAYFLACQIYNLSTNIYTIQLLKQISFSGSTIHSTITQAFFLSPARGKFLLFVSFVDELRKLISIPKSRIGLAIPLLQMVCAFLGKRIIKSNEPVGRIGLYCWDKTKESIIWQW